MRTDAAFCGNGEVRWIMENRRAHGECAFAPYGCEVVVGASCGRGRRVGRGIGWRRLLKGRMGEQREVEVMWIVGLVIMSLVANSWFILRLYLT